MRFGRRVRSQIINIKAGEQACLENDGERGGRSRPGERARIELRELLRDPWAEPERASAPRAPFSIDSGKQALHGAGRRRAQGLVEVDGLAKLFADHGVLAGEVFVTCQGSLKPLGLPPVEGAGGVPRQKDLQIPAVDRRVDRHIHPH